MSETQDILKPRFAQHIDIHCPDDRAYWAGQFGVTGEELRDAVKIVGSRVSTVAAHLGRQAA
ncbi:DUF3606 domain-containing protein [Methylobacterium nonmethylotrophicum]|uniref:DUF3606 domain-containing protein n=1 Tax=Methylobacterium nonmethylotrophicum TaxID=1141884 RepID=A0A4Z0NSA1_9HYPH|nr:DUF3606 domain-containing protein [Methylobacterium nonmethylotrophicum]TGD99266.1 DUF3606 domain-containing protein [Methylobacterium nonmethylotrophicum]